MEQLPTDGDAKYLLEEIQKAKESLNTKGKTKVRKMKVKDDVSMVAEPRTEYKKNK
ncbi:hypothetical protein [Plebeiibacterium sediminum]|uniref:Uncharacterized protein n=1 Tax=Plebeiibacterium sediminum TaxID=2992112 RepID=A0AAE3M820_9BACT|nr:hypothetical protein [Plebeiobacterium sediminum]MCW3788884.1 hypothetical protein [Plebeiobacterium sediminum]